MKLPASTKSGTASSAKFCVSVIVSCTGMVEGSSGCWKKNTRPEMPIAKATGMPISIRIVKAIRTSVIYRTSAAAAPSASPSPRRSSRIFNSVVTSNSAAPTGMLIVTQE